MISMIVAKSKNNVIGNENKLIWDIPEDMAHFRKHTLGKTIIMGRKTFESIGRPLPKRRNCVLTTDKNFGDKNNVEVFNSIESVLKLAEKEDIVIIGGSTIYEQFLPYSDILYVTEINKIYDGDSFFPEINKLMFSEIDSEEGKESSEKLEYFFKTYQKCKNI